jgi:hypothetical protein
MRQALIYERISRRRLYSSKARGSPHPGPAVIRAGNHLAIACLFFGAALAAFVSGSLEQRIGNLFSLGEAERLQGWLQPGQTVTVRGASLSTPLGTVMDVSAIGASPDQLTELAVGLPAGPKGAGPKGKRNDDLAVRAQRA